MKNIKFISSQIIIIFISFFIIEFTLRIINSDMTNYDIEMWRYSKELKISDPILGHKHVNGKSSILQNVEIKLNSDGMRSNKIDSTKKSILFIGSSISLGWGVEFNKIYPQLIQNNFITDSLNYQVLNGSVGNYNTYRYVNNFLSNQKNVKPDYLVVNYFINDSETLPVGESNWFIKNSQLCATLSLTLRKVLSKKGGDLKDYYKNLYSDQNKGFIEMKQSLKKLSEYGRENDLPIFLLLIPDIHFLEDYPFKIINKKMKSLSSEFNFIYFDLLPSLDGTPFKQLQIIEGDSHPNKLGHQKISESLYPFIKQTLIN